MTTDTHQAATAGSPDRAVYGDLAGYAVRPLGTEPSDLAIDLSDPLGPDTVTDVLVACLADAGGRPAPRPDLWAAPIGDRVAAMVAVAALAGDGRFSVALGCPVEACRDDLEIEITWDEIRSVARATAREPFEIDAARVRYRIRRPSAIDQERWRQAAATLAGISPRDVVTSLVVDGPIDKLTPRRLAAIEAALDDHDPLICFGLSVICPTCGTASRHELSLVRIAAAVLRRIQGYLVDDIHDLAHAYGWSEAAILAIPAWRRARYRALIAGDH